MADVIFTEGLYLNKVHANAPAFIVASVTIHRDKAITWLQNNPGLVDEKGYIRLTGKESKDGKRYFAVDTWKPTQQDNPLPTRADEQQKVDAQYDGAPPITDEDITSPF